MLALVQIGTRNVQRMVQNGTAKMHELYIPIHLLRHGTVELREELVRRRGKMKQTLRASMLLVLLMCALAWTIAPGNAELPTKENEKAESVGGEGEVRVLVGGNVQTMDMADYLTGVLRAEMPASFELEALKAQAVAARSYTLYRLRQGKIEAHPDADACDDITCCKAYMAKETAAENWGAAAAEYEEKLARAVEETEGEVVTYGGEVVLAVFFSSAPGRTQGAEEVWLSALPYLKSVPSRETEALVPNYYSTAVFTKEAYCDAVRAAYPDAKATDGKCITRIERNDAGFVSCVDTLGLTLRGNELRTALSLRSPYFEVDESDDTLTFHVTGYGHGVGMSQYGANAMAKEGAGYREILEHYYTGAQVEKAA